MNLLAGPFRLTTFSFKVTFAKREKPNVCLAKKQQNALIALQTMKSVNSLKCNSNQQSS